ncbi:MAG: GNAT family N-acetyltransferase [Chloroflexi bacterium]|nr:GNAT family N-acetyltransferase [Chloroflexota bacterium]
MPANPPELPVLRGDRLILRQPIPADVEARVEVPRDPEEHRMYGGSGEPRTFTREEAESILASITNQDLTKERRFVIAAFVWPDGKPIGAPDGRSIGGIRLHGINWPDRRARLAIGLFDRRFWSCGYGTEAVRLLLRHGFDAVGLHRIDLRVLAYNTRAIRCYEKCAFAREGIERESALVGGVWHDDVVMSILEQEYRAQPWAGRP